MKTLSRYLSSYANGGIIDFVLRVVRSSGNGDEASFYIHPQGFNGQTLDFTVRENSLKSSQVEYECEEGHRFSLISYGAIEDEYLTCPYCQKPVKEVSEE